MKIKLDRAFPFFLCMSFLLLLPIADVGEAEEFFEEEEIYDPYESVNRKTFGFNDGFDVYLMEPVARGYKWLLPQFIRTAYGNFIDNLRYPSYLVSDLVQFKFGQALEHSGRFLINSTIGIGGLIDVAEPLGIEPHTEDFGVALAYHGVPAGPYIMVPFWGPTTLRDGVGLLVDLALDPVLWLGAVPGISSKTATIASYSGTAVKMIHIRSTLHFLESRHT